MAVYSAEDIYGFARAAGFSPDQAATMTAIALAESGGNSESHNPVNEDSRGLWQINVEAHGERFGNLYDPAANAAAAYAVSQEGDDMSPWTVTHKGSAARYLQYQDEAQAAAIAHGDQPGLGVWTGVDGYGDHRPAGADGDGAAFPAAAVASDDDGVSFGTPGGPSVQDFLARALAQDGDKYLWGVEASYDDPDPDAFDCAELVEWAAAQVGVEGMAEVSYLQYVELRDAGAEMSVEEAIRTPGALLFRFGDEMEDGLPKSRHVAISLGDGRTIEARGSKWGVGTFETGDRFTAAAYIPGLDYGAGVAVTMPSTMPGPAATALPVMAAAVTPQSAIAVDVRQQPAMQVVSSPPPPLDPTPDDTDGDGITDAKEVELGLNKDSADSDDDSISDGYELAKLGSNPLRNDTDYDGLSDSAEVAMGTDPTVRDSDGDGAIDSAGLFFDTVDTDGDKLSDEIEAIIGTSITSIDTDRDGFTDFAEFEAGVDPLDPFQTLLASSSMAGGVSGSGSAGGSLSGADSVLGPPLATPGVADDGVDDIDDEG